MADNMESLQAHGIWTRRGFIGALGALVASSASGMGVAAPSQQRFAGRMVARNEPSYENWRTSMPWQLYTAPRYPDLIVRPDSAGAVAQAIAMARSKSHKVVVKSGGHNVSAAFMRDGGMMLDLGELQGIEVDPNNATAWVEPALWSHGLLRATLPHELAFPVAHCASVPMGGFLLGGGLGYNHDNWGTLACHSILAAEIVLASGETVVASPQQHPDLYWAVRGAGTGFFGVVTRYKIQLYTAPKAIFESSYIFPLAKLTQATEMLQQCAEAKPANTELMMLLAHNPMANNNTPDIDKKMCIVRAVTYAPSAAHARTALDLIASHPQIKHTLMKKEWVSTSLEQMQIDSVNANMGLGFGRYAVDTLWTDRLPQVMDAIKEHFVHANSVKSHFVISPKMNRKLPDNAAFSVIGNAFVGAYTLWDEAADDKASFAWLHRASKQMQQFARGQYINEVDGFRDPSAVQRCYSQQAWNKLNTLRDRYDPKGLFFSWPGTA